MTKDTERQGLETAMRKFADVFASPKSKNADERRADLDAWMLRGDEAALQRLSRGASKKAADWRYLGLMGMDVTDEAVRARGLRLASTAKSGEDLLAWIVGEGSADWIVTYHREVWSPVDGGPVETPTGSDPSERKAKALEALFATLRTNAALFKVAFSALDSPSRRRAAWELAATLGAQERKDGGVPDRTIRWIGPIALLKEGNTYSFQVLTDESAVDAFVAALPPVKARKMRGELIAQEGVVSIWLDTILDPKGRGDGKGGPLGWFDHDRWETAQGTLQSVIPRLSHGASFAAAALARAEELEAPTCERVDALFGHRFTDTPGKKSDGWFLGTFPYQKPSK